MSYQGVHAQSQTDFNRKQRQSVYLDVSSHLARVLQLGDAAADAAIPDLGIQVGLIYSPEADRQPEARRCRSLVLSYPLAETYKEFTAFSKARSTLEAADSTLRQDGERLRVFGSKTVVKDYELILNDEYNRTQHFHDLYDDLYLMPDQIRKSDLRLIQQYYCKDVEISKTLTNDGHRLRVDLREDLGIDNSWWQWLIDLPGKLS